MSRVNGQQSYSLPEFLPVLALYETLENPEHESKGDVIPAKGVKVAEKSKIKSNLNFNIGQTSYLFKFGGRIQTRFDYLDYRGNDPGDDKHKLYVRRLRFKTDGFLFTPDLEYKLEVDLLELKILDLVFKWNAGRNFSIWAGQTKLPGNRERVISSSNLQLVDRSLLNSKFTLDRDIGIWFMHRMQFGKMVFNEMFAVTKGEGIDFIYKDKENVFTGLDYTLRFELLPFGNFTGHGDYSEADLVREKTPKLALGLTFDFNNNAVKSNGQHGKVLDQHANLRSIFADAMFKYNGFSMITEYVNRNATDIFYAPLDSPGSYRNEFYIGNAFNSQIGYLFKNN
ncbi:MAG: hypothetical protein KFF73_16305, partial [Cyclobacteriaceae bacterium]|nr:hypothetical protein [Cyclobacteriaceae bacterium]